MTNFFTRYLFKNKQNRKAEEEKRIKQLSIEKVNEAFQKEMVELFHSRHDNTSAYFVNCNEKNLNELLTLRYLVEQENELFLDILNSYEGYEGIISNPLMSYISNDLINFNDFVAFYIDKAK